MTETILNQTDPGTVVGVEPSDGFLKIARDRIQDDRAEFKSGDALSLPVNDSEADVLVSGLVLNFVENKERAVQEMCRVVKPGGTIAAYVWDYAGEMQLMRYFWSAASELFPDGVDQDEGKQFPICQAEAPADLFSGANLETIETSAIDAPTVFTDFNDCWSLIARPRSGGVLMRFFVQGRSRPPAQTPREHPPYRV